jgi:hypothetical protein
MRDISDLGVGLQLHEREELTSSFKITLDNFESVKMCQRIWSRGHYIGAIFRQNCDPADLECVIYRGDACNI